MYAKDEGCFRPHEWIQIYDGGRWIDVDPSLPNYLDPTHIALDIATKGDRSSWGWMLWLSSYRLVRVEVLESDGGR